VENHRLRNRAVRPPSPSLLLESAVDQPEPEQDEDENEDEDENDEEAPLDERNSLRAPRGTKGIGQGDEDLYNLCHWNRAPALKNCVIRAMNAFRVYLALVKPFPNCEEDFGKAEQFIADEIEANIKDSSQVPGASLTLTSTTSLSWVYRSYGCKANGNCRKCLLFYMCLATHIDQVWRVGSSQRSTWKRAGRNIVKIHYTQAINPNNGQPLPANQVERAATIKKRIEELIGTTHEFLHAEPNAQVSGCFPYSPPTNNLGHLGCGRKL